MHLIDRTIAASNVSYSSRTPQTTTLRWLAYLEEKRVLWRAPDSAGVRRDNLFVADRRIESIKPYLERARTVQ